MTLVFVFYHFDPDAEVMTNVPLEMSLYEFLLNRLRCFFYQTPKRANVVLNAHLWRVDAEISEDHLYLAIGRRAKRLAVQSPYHLGS